MNQEIACTVFILFFTLLIGESVKIGVSKAVSENATIEANETTTPDPVVSSTSSKTTVTTSTMPTTTTSSTTKQAQSSSTTKTTLATTTMATPSTTESVKNNSQPSRIRNEHSNNFRYFCVCDLRHRHCDIDCCCDIDCTPDELNSFNCDREEMHLEDVHYHPGLPPCKINEGWLCVFRNNAENTKHKVSSFSLDTPLLQEWPTLLRETSDLSHDQEYYKIGEPVLLYNPEANEIIEYDIPYSLTGQHCQIFESIRHLVPQNTSCLIPIEKAQTLEAMLFQKLCTSFLLQRPSTQIPINGIIKETNPGLISINLFRCSNNFDCLPASISNSTYDAFDEIDYSAVVQTKIYHNITNLIACDVFFVQSDQKSEKVWQRYEVQFIHRNETEGFRHSASGPLGYHSGRPLIIGRKVPFNDTEDHPVESNLVLSYFHPNRTESVHIHPPRRRQGCCEDSHATVNFGESILVECAVQLDNTTEFSSETNFTRICADLQSRSLRFLQLGGILERQEEHFISILGYPVNKTDHWTKIEVRNYEHLPVVGMYLGKEYAFICQNMILGLKYEFLTVNEVAKGVPHQNVLKRATIEVGRRHDLQFQMDEMISIPITFSVVFQDLRDTNGAETWASCFNLVCISILFFVVSL